MSQINSFHDVNFRPLQPVGLHVSMMWPSIEQEYRVGGTQKRFCSSPLPHIYNCLSSRLEIQLSFAGSWCTYSVILKLPFVSTPWVLLRCRPKFSVYSFIQRKYKVQHCRHPRDPRNKDTIHAPGTLCLNEDKTGKPIIIVQGD